MTFDLVYAISVLAFSYLFLPGPGSYGFVQRRKIRGESKEQAHASRTRSFLERLKVSKSKGADWDRKDAELERAPVILRVLIRALGVLAGRADSADRRRAALKNAQQLLAELPRQPIRKFQPTDSFFALYLF
jgi:hypothetical protein